MAKDPEPDRPRRSGRKLFEPPNLGGWRKRDCRYSPTRWATPRQVAQHIMADDVYVIDVRNQAEWEEERLPAARPSCWAIWRSTWMNCRAIKPLVLHCCAAPAQPYRRQPAVPTASLESSTWSVAFPDWTADGLPVDQGILMRVSPALSTTPGFDPVLQVDCRRQKVSGRQSVGRFQCHCLLPRPLPRRFPATRCLAGQRLGTITDTCASGPVESRSRC